MQNNIYFASDFHFGVPDHDRSLEREKLFVKWLDEIRVNAAEIYLMGDLFDFWFEYKTVIPRGYVRLFGKLAEITDSGIQVHLFKGNHDMWAFNYMTKELNIQLHRDPEIKKFGNKIFYLAHGDGLGPGDHGYKFIKKVFQSPVNQWLFRWIHPDLGSQWHCTGHEKAVMQIWLEKIVYKGTRISLIRGYPFIRGRSWQQILRSITLFTDTGIIPGIFN